MQQSLLTAIASRKDNRYASMEVLQNIHRIKFDTINVVVIETNNDIWLNAKNVVSYLNLSSPANEYRKMYKLGMDLGDFALPPEFGGKYKKTQKFIRIGEVERYLASYNIPHGRFKPPLGFAEAIRRLKGELVQTVYDALDELTPEQKLMMEEYDKSTESCDAEEQAVPAEEPKAEEPEPKAEEPEPKAEEPKAEEPEPKAEEPKAEEPEPKAEEPADDSEEEEPEEREETQEDKELKLRMRIRALQMDMFGIEVQVADALDILHNVSDNLNSYKNRVKGVIKDAQELYKTEED